MLPEILSQYTNMPIHIITDGMKVSPGNVYVIPSNRDLGLAGSKFVLGPLSKHFGWPRVITNFLQSLAREWRRQAIAVILSGLGVDGTQGLASIKAAGGVTFAQSPPSARCASMPETAINSGCVDFVLPPEDIAHELVRIAVTRKK
jgi:chemotaxis response regulator CheB